MQHTTNYNLNQWEDADRVTRADVNADNAAVDAALKTVSDAAETAQGAAETAQATAAAAAAAAANASRLVKVYDVTTTEALTQIDVPYAALHVADYYAVLLLVEWPAGAGSSDAMVNYRMLVDGKSSDYRTTNTGGNANYLGMGFDNTLMILRAARNDDVLHCNSYSYMKMGFLQATVTYIGGTASSVTTLNILTQGENYRHPIGTRVVAYGLRLL